MSLPRFSVHRPVFTTMVTLIVMILGGAALLRLPIDLLPEINLPTISIATRYENASPEEMERLVTELVEETVASVPGVEELTSSSTEGQSNVRVSFVWGTDLDAAANDIRDRLDRIRDNLPEDADSPQLRKFDVASFPVLILGVSSELDPIELTDLIEDQIQYRIERIPGVASAEVWGGFEREIQVAVDLPKLRALQVPLEQVVTALRNANVTFPAGEIEQGQYEVTLRTPGEFHRLDQIESTVIAHRGGAPVLLSQIATVSDSHRKVSQIVRINGERGVRVGVRKQSDANTVEVSERVLEEIDRINHDLPQAKIVPVINQADFIRRSIDNVSNSVLWGGALAVLVLLFFLRNIRSTLVIALAIPISIVATFALVFFGGFTLNLMTLGGLALGVGMMVDNSIVVLENIVRHRDEQAEGRQQAAVSGSIEVSGAIVAATLTTLVIFLPLVFVRGVAGVLFQQFAFVVGFSLICSLLVALSLVPMLSSKILRPRAVDSARRGFFRRAAGVADRAFTGFENSYRDLLRGALRVRFAVIGAALLLFAATLLLVPYIGSEFMPPSDEGEVRVTGQMEVGTKLDVVDRQTKIMEGIVAAALPEAVSTVTSVGPSGWRADEVSEGELRISLPPASQRTRSNAEIADDLRSRLEGRIPGMEIRTRAPQGMSLMNRLIGGDDGIEVEIRGYDFAVLDQLAAQLAEKVKEVEGVTDVRVSREAGGRQELLRVDRDKAADLGLTVRQVAQAFESAVAGAVAGEFRESGDEVRILVKLADAEKLPLEDILDLTLPAANGEPVALRNIVSVESARGPMLIDRKDQQRIVSVSANIYGRDLGSIAEDVKAKFEEIARPVGYEFAIAGNYEEQQEAFQELLVSLILALVLVYMVMACQYESLRDPLVVMFSVPFAAVGVLVTLLLTDTTLNLQSYIGCIMLGGIVVNNAILLVDQAGQLRRAGMDTHEAAAEAGRRRLRPILMTTLTTILGMLPLAMGIGEGADAQAPLARAVIGGLSGSTLVTLLFIPALYTIFHPRRRAEAAS